MRKIKRGFALILAILMLLPVVIACQKKDTSQGKDSTPQGEVTTSGDDEKKYEYDENGYVKDRIPDKKYNGEEVHFLCWTSSINFTLPEENMKHEVIEKVYLRRLEIEERLNIKLKFSTEKGEYQDGDTFLAKARLSGENGYDLICSYSLWPAQLAQEGYLHNLLNFEFPQLDMPWWPQSISEWEQNGSLFFISSNSSVQTINCMEVMFCNSSMFVNRGMKDPVTLALEGNWTMDTMLQYVKNFQDNIDSSDSVYGLAVDDHSRMDCFYYGAGFNSTRNNAEGVAEIPFTSESEIDRITTLIDKMVPVWNSSAVTIEKNTAQLMVENKTALMVASLAWIKNLNDLNYAPIPAPKLDSDQKDYKVIQNNGYDVWCIPVGAKNPELSAILIEAVASSDYRDIAPFYFDKYMKLRYSSDTVSSQMFELVRSSIIYDFGRINQKPLLGIAEAAWRWCFWDYGADMPRAEQVYSSYIQRRGTEVTILLKEILANYRKYQNAEGAGS